MAHWFEDAVFYHIYPLGCCGAPLKNDYSSAPTPRLRVLMQWITYIRNLGANALYLGPVFESGTHGYDTTDYFTVDRRLGENVDLRDFIRTCQREGVRVVLDAVFNHVGRDHFAFNDLKRNGRNSKYREWFHLDFNRRSVFGDPFWYVGWHGHYNLVKLNLAHPAVRDHLLGVVKFWQEEFGPDGLRLDAADSMDRNFFRGLRTLCKTLRPDFWLMGEVIHGNYRDWANPDCLDSVTNYECYKGLWSSLNDGNCFEIAYSLNRQFGSSGIYKGLPLYNFADNHDVDRVASTLRDRSHLLHLYIMLFTMPGIPSVYYGSEWGLLGRKWKGTDAALRPAIDLSAALRSIPDRNLFATIKTLIAARRDQPVLRRGTYSQLWVASRQFCFLRRLDSVNAVVALNFDKAAVTANLKVPVPNGTVFADILNNRESFTVKNGSLDISLSPSWGRILVR